MPFRRMEVDIHGDWIALADYLRNRRMELMLEWHRAAQRDSGLSQGDSLLRTESLLTFPRFCPNQRTTF